MRFLHCSDIHISIDYFNHSFTSLTWRRKIALMELKFGGRADAFATAEQTVQTIARDAEAAGVDHLIVSGDITAYGLQPEFQRAKVALSPWADMPERCTVIQGNHDTYSPEVLRNRWFEQSFGHLTRSDIECSVEGSYPFVRLLGDDVAVVGLLSARVPAFPGMSFGWIGKKQIEALADVVRSKELASRFVFVVVHHAPLNANGKPDKLTHGLRDAKALFRAVPGSRFAVLHGHIHKRYRHPASPDRPYIFGAGSSTQKGREGYWLIEVEDAALRNARMCEPGEWSAAAA